MPLDFLSYRIIADGLLHVMHDAITTTSGAGIRLISFGYAGVMLICAETLAEA